MKVVVYLHVPLWKNHLAEIVEVVLSHLNQKDEVHLLRCKGALFSCPANPYHKTATCEQCRTHSDHVVKLINSSLLIEDVLEIENTNKAISYSDFQDVNELKLFSVDGVPHGWFVGSQITDDLSDSFPDTISLKERISNLLECSISLFNASLKYLGDIKPDRVYVWNGRRCSDGPVICAAQKLGIDFYGLMSGGEYNTFAIFPNSVIHDLDFQKHFMEDLYLSNENYEDRFTKATKLFSEQRYGNGSYPGFIHFASTFRKGKIQKIDTSKRLVVIFSSSYWEFVSVPHYAGGLYPDHYKGLESILSDEGIDENIRLIVRWHPNLRNVGKRSGESKKISSIVEKYSSRAMFVSPDSNVDSYTLMDAAEKVVTFGSTIGIESVYYGKPSILIGRAVYESTGACYTPQSHKEVIELINSTLAPRDIDGALKYGYYLKSYGQHKFKFLKRTSDGDFLLNGSPIHKKSISWTLFRIQRGLANRFKRLF